MAVPHVAEARAVEASIQAVIPDIRLMWDPNTSRWVVVQIKQNPGGFILPGLSDMPSQTRPSVLYRIQAPKTNAYRPPASVDVKLAINIGRFGREAIAKGGDWLIDEMEKAEAEAKVASRQRLHDHVKAVAPDLKRALRKR